MENHLIFRCETYLQVILEKLKGEGHLRGYRALLAEAAGCQRAYLSQVLSEKAQLTPDHGEGLCVFWGLNDLESDYFLNLIYLARAATPKLVARLKKKLQQLREEDEASRGTQTSPDVYDKDFVIDYFLDWVVAATHAFIEVPQFQQIPALAKRLQVDESRIQKALVVLQKLGFASNENGLWKSSVRYFHVADETKFAPLHHLNWHKKASESILSSTQKSNLNYTALHTLSLEDCAKIKTVLQTALRKSQEIVKPSKEETVACLSLNWFIV